MINKEADKRAGKIAKERFNVQSWCMYKFLIKENLVKQIMDCLSLYNRHCDINAYIRLCYFEVY